MRPRLIAVDDDLRARFRHRAANASMRPRLIAVDDRIGADHEDAHGEASMRPRLIAVDDCWSWLSPPRRSRRFNEATAYCRG